MAEPTISAQRPEADLLYRGERTIVERGHGAVTKLMLGPDALARMRHEARILERLKGLPGVSQLIAAGPGAMLVLRDSGGASLARAAPLDATDVLELARRLARALAGIHQRGVLHLDITPANVVRGADGEPELIDFHLASLSAEERRDFTRHNEIAGTLAYMAPELTGRVGAAIDHRADLYALGATLYELATGAPPFGRGDPLRLMRDLLAAAPVSPSLVAPDLPPPLSEIILRLLEKEPDRRYQSAEGLADDLERLRDRLARGETATFPLGATDFPVRLLPPSRLIGREIEIAALREAIGDALAGQRCFLLVRGEAGVGKTALIEHLRAIVTAREGRFVVGRFESDGNAATADPFWQVVRGIVALLLVEPEAELASLREALRARLGADAGLLRTVVPAIEALIGSPEPPEDATEARTGAAGFAFLQAVSSPTRPLVIAFDDLQWARPNGLRRLGRLAAAEGLPGLLLVGVHRDGDADATARLDAEMDRWRKAGVSARILTLPNLPLEALTELLIEMLRLPRDAALQLAEAVDARTAGNPFDTLELLNGLRREGALFRGASGWEWDRVAIRRHVGDAEVSGLLAARIAALPAATRDLLADMACLGAEVAPSLLAAASGIAGPALEELLSPALEDGLLVRARGGVHAEAALSFAHRRVRQSIDDGSALETRHLALARRLALRAEYASPAAEQYLAALGALGRGDCAPGECRLAAALFSTAGAAAARSFHHEAAESFYAAAVGLVQAALGPRAGELTRLRTAQLIELYNLGRHQEGDEVFAALDRSDDDPLSLAEATCVQALSLSNRTRHREAVAIGLAKLEKLGMVRPADMAGEVARGLAAIPTWLRGEAVLGDADRVRARDPLVRAVARLINRLLPPAQLYDPLTGAWLALESLRLWSEHGVCPEVVANLARSAASPNVFGEDYRTGYEMARLAVATGAAYGWEPETSLARQNFATFAVHWFEPLENTAIQVAAARDGLIQSGEIQAACINYISSLGALMDCAPTLEVFAAELAQAREFTARTGNDNLFASFHSHQQLLDTLNGAIDPAACLAERPSETLANMPLSLFSFHCSHAIAAALFDDVDGLAYFSAAAMPLLIRIGGAYRSIAATLLHALALAASGRRAGVPGPLPPEFAALRAWFAARAADAPWNFSHLLHFLDAEAAWTAGDAAAAIRAFDQALQSCFGQTRPWHHALIAERAGKFHLEQGLDYAGRALLRDARNRYAAWGATAVARRLGAEHGFLESMQSASSDMSGSQTGSLSADAIDLMAILRASQALSSQTTVAALHARVAETLAAMTGATSVRMAIWDARGSAWRLPPEADAAGETVEEAAARGALPLSVFRYVERTRTALVVDDVKLDDRFARDPYFAAMTRCSLMALPVQNQGAPRAMLMLENALSRGVFSRARLNVVTLVASQLAVSLDNAQLYASLERRVAERTEALAAANLQLEALSLSDALTGLSNRRHFDVALRREWRHAWRVGASVGLVMIDIDYFKRYNDHYGHVGGDRCLRAVADVLAANARSDSDIAARYGGEEFALILPRADSATAAMVAGRIRDAVASLEEPHPASPFGFVTISLGVAAMVPGTATAKLKLVELADAALYRAKQEGRDRVAVAGDAEVAAVRVA